MTSFSINLETWYVYAENIFLIYTNVEMCTAVDTAKISATDFFILYLFPLVGWCIITLFHKEMTVYTLYF